MRTAMKEDRAKHNILPVTKFGLMQITRQRVRPELNEHIVEKCPVCRGRGEIAPSILFEDELFNNLADILEQEKIKHIILRTHPYIAAYLNKGLFSLRWKWSRKLKCSVKIIPDSSFALFESKFFNKNVEEIIR
jgi:ribonuclease G